MARSILVIDDDRNIRWVLKKALQKAGYAVETAEDGDSGLFALVQNPFDLVVLDLKMPGVDGLGVLRQIHKRRPDLPVILLTAHATVSTAVEAMRLGAIDYLRKPFDVEEIRFKIARALEQHADRANALPPAAEPTPLPPDELVGATEIWLRLREQVGCAAGADEPVLVWGEPGVGSTSIAHWLYRLSPQARQPLVVVDGSLLSAEALWQKLLTEGGALAHALGGCLLVDHIEGVPADIQAELGRQLAALIHRGGALAAPRLIAVSSAEVGTTTPSGLLHPDLWQLVSAITLRVPPLRERMDDLPLLLKHLAPQTSFTPAARAFLQEYNWPGNVRQLHSAVSHALALAGNTPIDLSHLPASIVQSGSSDSTAARFKLPLEGIDLESVERDLIQQALTMARGNKTQAARLLGLSRHTFLYRLEKYNLQNPETKSD